MDHSTGFFVALFVKKGYRKAGNKAKRNENELVSTESQKTEQDIKSDDTNNKNDVEEEKEPSSFGKKKSIKRRKIAFN